MAEARGPGRYLFAVARGLDGRALDGLVGLRSRAAGGRRAPWTCRRWCARSTSPSSARRRSPRNLEDLAWVEEVARAHNDVVWRWPRSATVAPMRLVTICADDDSVCARVEGAYDGLAAALDRVEGRREWSVKVYAAPPEPPSRPLRSPPGRASGSGAAYLQRKREQAARAARGRRRATQAAEQIHDALAGKAAAHRARCRRRTRGSPAAGDR